MHMRRGRGAGAVEGKSTADGRRTEEGGRTGPRASGHGTVEWPVVGLAVVRSVGSIHPPGHACVDRTAMQVRRICRMHEGELAAVVGGEGVVAADQQARHEVVGRYD